MTSTAFLAPVDVPPQVVGDIEPASLFLVGLDDAMVLNKAAVTFDAQGAATLSTIKNTEPSLGSLVVIDTEKSETQLVVTSSFPVSGAEEAAEFRAGWMLND